MSMIRYNPKELEPKWQRIWEETGVYTADLGSNKPKYIAMSMFNYPSGAGIHIGHAMNYTIPDVKARFMRQRGYESYHPIGWDAFGLPAENYAIKAGVSPQESMAKIIPGYHKQYKAMGWSNDWEKEIATHLPEYYKWTQWIFSQMYKQNLAYQDARLQWWCDQCQTVLANEQVIDGKCWRHDGPDDPIVKKKEVRQWFFKITEYADELLEAIDSLDWTETVKSAQRNWIGKSNGAEIDFALHKVCNPNPQMARSYVMGQQNISKQDIELLGGKVAKVTEKGHLCIEFPAAKAEKFEALISEKMEPGFWNEYITNEKVVFIFKENDGGQVRYELNEKNAHEICVLGNRFNNQPEPKPNETAWNWLENNPWYAPIVPKVKVFTTRADTIFSCAFLVLAPEHDLVKKVTTQDQKEAVEAYVASVLKKSELERQANKDKTAVFTGAYAANPANGEKVPVWVSDFVLVGYGTGAVFGDIHDERDFELIKKFDIPARVTVVPENEAEKAKVLAKEYAYTQEGVLIDSGDFTGKRSEIARDEIIKWLAKKGTAKEVTNYKMRDWSVSRQRYWGAPIPIINCANCGTVLVPDEDLPVLLPELTDFKPSGDGRSALARADDWLKVDCLKCGGPAERETDTLDTYICSSWYMYRYFDPHNQQAIFDSKIVKKWEPIDFYNGADHATAHLLYARFIARFFTKLGLVDEPEPFKQFLFNGKVMASDGSAFSKSKGNGVDPLEIIEQGYGADALRTYLMFAAPLEFSTRWDPQGVPSAHRFLSRLWNLVQEYLASAEGSTDAKLERQLNTSVHKMIKKVTEDINENRYNTAIASMMSTVNDMYKLKTDQLVSGDAWRQSLESITACVAPFAPHIADELWQQLGHSNSVHCDTWPGWEERFLVGDTMKLAVQVNGKLRGELSMAADADKQAIVEACLKLERVRQQMEGKNIIREIYVPGKLVNLVVSSK